MGIRSLSTPSKWVWLKDKPEERFVGFLYLKNALEMAGIQSVVAASNKIALYGRKIIYLSEYAGEVHSSVFKYFNEIRAFNQMHEAIRAGFEERLNT